ncbi:MAG: hypothetical protein ACXADC_17710 [Candidatus Thorarchaeota archaeon]
MKRASQLQCIMLLSFAVGVVFMMLYFLYLRSEFLILIISLMLIFLGIISLLDVVRERSKMKDVEGDTVQ